jgi:hypothetical protein
MGMFGVNMSLLYGEGASNAYFRLQQEIANTSIDHSLFAWTRERDAMNGNFLPRNLMTFGTQRTQYEYGADIS